MKNKKDVRARDSRTQKSRHGNEKLIRLDDLIPKQHVTGGHHQLLFGVTETTQTSKGRRRK